MVLLLPRVEMSQYPDPIAIDGGMAIKHAGMSGRRVGSQGWQYPARASGKSVSQSPSAALLSRRVGNVNI